MSRFTRRAACSLLGAATADAAALGLHWLYDVAHLAELAGDEPEFREPSAADFAGKSGYFAHALRRSGDLSQYGEVLRLFSEHLAARGELDIRAWQEAFRAHFGPGGAWTGYIDSPTRATLANLAEAAAGKDTWPESSGADDVQLPALATLPALVLRYGEDETEAFRTRVERVVRVTHHNDKAVAAALFSAELLRGACSGSSLSDSLSAAMAVCPDWLAPAIERATEPMDGDLHAVAAELGQACNLSQGLPVSLWILRSSSTGKEAMRRNILAGGDSCGRAILLGALVGALHGIGGDGVPWSWLLRLREGQNLGASVDTLST